MDPLGSGRNRQLTADILAYFLQNPRAADNLEGILRWRLLGAAVQHVSADISDAVDWLIEQGYLKEHITRGSGRNLCLNPERRDAAERALAELRQEVPGAED